MEELTIGEVARQAGLRTSAIRYYESLGLLPAAQRVGGQRRYTADVVPWLRMIQVAQAAGCALAELRDLFGGAVSAPPHEAWRALADAKIALFEEQIAHARQMQALLEQTRTCECPTIEECVLLALSADSIGHSTAI